MLAETLRCGYYHSELSKEDKTDRIRVWLDGGGWIVATTALGTGVDYAGIVFVLHVGMSYGMINYTQEFRRAGQSEKMTDSMILMKKRET